MRQFEIHRSWRQDQTRAEYVSAEALKTVMDMGMIQNKNDRRSSQNAVIASVQSVFYFLIGSPRIPEQISNGLYCRGVTRIIYGFKANLFISSSCVNGFFLPHWMTRTKKGFLGFFI